MAKNGEHDGFWQAILFLLQAAAQEDQAICLATS